MGVIHTHHHVAMKYRQEFVDHLVTVHMLSPTHFRDKPSLEDVVAVHDKQHDERCQGERRDSVNHPTHYNQHPSGVECIDIIEWMPLNIGNAVKYLWRAGLKDSAPTAEDYKKAIWYINREIERLEKISD